MSHDAPAYSTYENLKPEALDMMLLVIESELVLEGGRVRMRGRLQQVPW